MDSDLSLHVRMFNDRVRVMNQSQAKNLVLTAQEARNLHADIFALLTQFAELSNRTPEPDNIVSINMDGGKY